jgi:class 3 adenylate cyclase
MAIALRVFWMPQKANFTLQATAGWRSRHAVVFAVDIADFTAAERDDEVQLALRDVLYRVLIDAFDAAGVAWEQCLVEDHGDGVLVIMPAQLPIATVIDPLLIFLRAGLRRHNRLSREVAHIHLRAALHVGEVHRDAHGVAGNAVNLLFRLLDAPVLKEALVSQGTELALIVSDQMYEQAVRRNPELMNPTAYRPVIAATKKTRAHAWIRIAAADYVRR